MHCVNFFSVFINMAFNKVTIHSLVFLLIVLVECFSYEILVIFPTGAYSHQQPQQAISRALADKGHHLTVISPNKFEPSHPNITEIDISFTYDYAKLFDLSDEISEMEILNIVSKYFTLTGEHILSHEPVKNLLARKNNEKFDAVLVEFLFHTPLFMAKHIFNATLIGFSTLELSPSMHSVMGNVVHPVLHPSFFFLQKNHGFIDRIKMTYKGLFYHFWMNYNLLPENDKLIQKHFPDFDFTSKDLLNSVDFAIEGVTPVLGNVRPLTPNTIQIGFLHIKDPKPLPLDLEKYLNQSRNGVIYVSFGSTVKSSMLQSHLKQIFIETFKGLEYDILWKYEDDTLDNKPNNVKIQKWLPQSDLLGKLNDQKFIDII